jgi:hypothetical protein
MHGRSAPFLKKVQVPLTDTFELGATEGFQDLVLTLTPNGIIGAGSSSSGILP